MRRTSIILCSAALLLVTVLGMPSCDAQASVEKDSSICVATWNVQNLFNAVLDGSEYDEYRPESGWNQEAYGKRLSNAAKVIRYLPDSGELIVVLNEVEGPDVVEDLIKTGDLAKSGLRWYACTESEGSAVQTAVVSSIPISYANVHDVGDGLRPVLEVCFETDRGRLFILAVHFKSNIGGTDETAAQREAGARVAAEVADVIERENPGCLVMICGDMNEECWDERMMGKSGPLPASDSFGRRNWYCFWKDPEASLWPNGSYWYDGNWKCYDNILVSASGRDGAGLEMTGCGVVFRGILSNAGKKPAAWDRRLLSGVSDHLPVWVSIQ
jgi:endonuclease/exonuclease/phosphatase family metal-dependent hydrolase